MPFAPQFALTDRAGDTLDYIVEDLMEGGVPVDLTVPGTEVWVTGKLTYATADPGVFQKKLSTGGVVPLSQNSLVVTLDPADTENLADGTELIVDVQVKAPNGRLQTPVEGRITYFTDVTQATT